MTVPAAAPDGEVSTLPSPQRAQPARGLTDPERSEGDLPSKGRNVVSAAKAKGVRTRKGRVATFGRRKTRDASRGASALKLARGLRRWLLRGPLHRRRTGDARPRVYSVTFTCRSGREVELRAMVPQFLAVVAARCEGAGLLLALDVSTAGRWHLHGLALLRRHVDPALLVKWWARCWKDRAERPVRKAQKVRPLADCPLRVRHELDRVLRHHLARKRDGTPVPAAVPSLAERVTAFGALVGPWKGVAGATGALASIVTVARRQRPRRSSKASTSEPALALVPARSCAVGVACAWCGKPFRVGTRCDARFDSVCRRAASRALRLFEKRRGRAARERVDKLEKKGWLRRDAMRSVERMLHEAEQEGIDPPDAVPRPMKCTCGTPLALRASARTCGSSTCRAARWRELLPSEARRLTRPEFASLLEQEFRGVRFSEGEATALAKRSRFDGCKVREVLQQLVGDGAVHVVDSGGERYSWRAYVALPTDVHADRERRSQPATLASRSPPGSTLRFGTMVDSRAVRIPATKRD